MAFFNFRRSGSNPAAAGPAAQPESVETIRKRAKHRLIGAVVLVLLGVVGFPLLFDTQPRPIAVDIPIEIPGKNTLKPLTLPEAVAPESAADKVSAGSSLSPKEEIVPSKPVTPALGSTQELPKAEARTEPKTEARTEPKTEPKAETKVEAKAEPKGAPKPEAKTEIAAKPPAKTESKAASKPTHTSTDEDGARARALLNGAPQAAKPAAVESGGRVVVQVGAFADSAKANEARTKLERAGLKTYTQVAETKDGKRTRVRVGPFASKAEAEQSVEKIKALGLSAAVLTL